MNRTLRYLLNVFFRGLLILGPIAVTAYALYLIFSTVDNLIPGLPTGLGFFFVLFIVTFIGFLGTRFFLGRWLVEFFDFLFERTPGINFLYTTVKEVLHSFMGDKKKFNDPVWVKTNETPEVWRIGFLTQNQVAEAGEDMVAVYLPHAYAISGWVIMVNRMYVMPVTGMNAAEAMKFAVSGGMVGNGHPAGAASSFSQTGAEFLRDKKT